MGDTNRRDGGVAGTVTVTCQCGKSFRVSQRHRGRRARCLHCGAPLVIPAEPAQRTQSESEGVADASTLAGARAVPAPDETGKVRRPAVAEPPGATVPEGGPASGYGLEGRLLFGNYELLSEVARGGMGVVYKARQTKLDRIVALKTILKGQFADEADVKRFYVEAQAAACLDHPAIVPVFEVGQHEGEHFYSMRFIDGQSLSALSAAGKFPHRRAAEMVLALADAVQYAHERGVIHRDLNPNNVLVDLDGQPHITDFGLAMRVALKQRLTASGQVMGTPSYMPPEQASARRDLVGPTADVYALGAILYKLLTGRPPFQASGYVETLLKVLEEPPVSPRQLDPAVPQPLAALCLDCLEKDPARRPRSAQAVVDALERFLKDDAELRQEYEARMAREIQEGLRPKTCPGLTGFDIAGACHPAAATGSDYYDYLPMPEGSLGIVLASMSSRGFGPALIMAGVRRVLRTLASIQADLAEILTITNRAVAEDTGSEHFVTLFLARIDPASRKLSYAGAGHEAYRLDPSGQANKLSSTSLALGIEADTVVACGDPLTLAAGELVILLSDGFQAARAPDGRHYGVSRALTTASAARGESAARILDALFQDVRDFCHPDVPQDDVTALVVKSL